MTQTQYPEEGKTINLFLVKGIKTHSRSLTIFPRTSGDLELELFTSS